MKLSEFLRDWRDNRKNTISMRLSNKEKFIIDTLKGSGSYSDHYISLIKYLAGENPKEKAHFKRCFPKNDFQKSYDEKLERERILEERKKHAAD